MRPSLAAGLATDRISRLSWPNVSFAANHRWTCQSIIVIAIDLFTSEDRYFLWIAAVPLFTIPTTFGNAHARCYTREAPLIQSATQVGSSQLDSSRLNALTVPWSHNVSNNCMYIHSCLLRWYKLNCNRFNHCERPMFFSQHRPSARGHQRQSGRHFFLLWSGDCTMTLAFHVLQKICRIKIFIKIYLYI